MSYILIVEDDAATSLLLKTYLNDFGMPVIVAETSHDALDMIKKESPEVILLDINLPDINGLDFIKTILLNTHKSEIIIVTGEKGADKALTALNAGAKDYLTKPVEKERLLTTVTNSLERIELNRKIDDLKTGQENEHPHYKIIGSSKPIKELHKIIDRVAKTKEPILIYGERGTGKSMVAGTIHALRNHNENELNQINGALLQEDDKNFFSDLLQTPAKTLYISNLSELPESLQRLLLRMMDENSLPPIIWSSVSEPLRDTKENKLRDDLYYRLNVVKIDTPPLREREKDIIILANHFLNLHAKVEDKKFEDFTPKALDTLINYHWPGNVLELRNMIRHIVIMNQEAQHIDTDMLPKHISSYLEDGAQEGDLKQQIDNIETLFRGDSIIPIRDLEEMAIRHALKICDGNIQEAASNLKISPATLYRKKPPIH